MKENLKERWKEICGEYLDIFCKKHGYEIHECYDYFWVANNPGTIVYMCDMFINMDDIRYDIDNDIPDRKFEKWYWDAVECY